MKDVDLVCDMITVCRERLETDLQYEKPLCDLIKVCGLVSDICINVGLSFKFFFLQMVKA